MMTTKARRERWGKKAFGLQTYALVLAFIIGLGAFYSASGDYVITRAVGDIPLALQQAASEARQSSFSLHHAASLALMQTVYALAQEGQAACESYYAYPLMAPDDQSCLLDPETVRLSFSEKLDEELPPFLRAHNARNAFVPLDSYKLSIVGDIEAVGTTQSKIQVPIIDGEVLEQERKDRVRRQAQEASSIRMTERAGLTAITAVKCDGSCLLKPEAYERLLEANRLATQKGFEIYVESSYRPLSHQERLWRSYAEKYPDPEVRDDFVCNPHQPGAERTCTHVTAQAVDVWIWGKSKSQMTSQDWQLLEDVMAQAGWVRYEAEAWHFEYGTERWEMAQQKGVSVHG